MAIPPLVLRIYADSSGVRAGVMQAQSQVGGLKNTMQRNAGLIKLAMVGAFVGIGVAAVKAFNESEAAIAQTEAVLKSTGGAAGVTADEVTNLATEMQKLTTFSDEEIRVAENLLLTFQKISSDIFPQTTQAVLDMSTALGQDLKSSSLQLGKALNDPVAGITALKRAGVSFSPTQLALIKNLAETNRLAEAQALILKEVTTEFGGSAKNAAKTFGGQMKQVQNQIDDLLEVVGELIVSLGKNLLPVITHLVNGLRQIADGVNFVTDAFSTGAEEAKNNADFLLNVADAYHEGKINAEQFAEVLLEFGHMAGWDPDKIKATTDALGAVPIELGKGRAAYHKLAAESVNTGGAMGRFTSMTAEKFKEWAATAGENFDAVKDGFDNLAQKAHVTATAIIREFTRQANNIRDYRDNLQEVADRNIPDALLQQLIGMGTEGADILAELAGASDSKFNQMVRAMQRARSQNNRLINDIRNLRDEASRDIVFNVRFQTENLPDPRMRAGGGPVAANTPYIVGERGPELFVPNTAGNIVPNDQMMKSPAGAPVASGVGDITIPVYLGDELLERVVVRGLNRAAARL